MTVTPHTFSSSSAKGVLTQSSRVATYLFKGATREEQQIAIAALNGRISWDDALDRLQPYVEAAIQAEAKQALTSLHTALVASGDWDRAKMTAELSRLDPLNWERFDELTAGLRLSFAVEGMSQHVDLVDRIVQCSHDLGDQEMLAATAWSWFRAEMDEIEKSPPFRLHASPAMQELLGVSSRTPDYEAVRWLIANRRGDGTPISGKYYHPFQEPVADGMTRLYRVGPTPSEAKAIRDATPVPEWLKQGTELSGADGAMGRWFTSDPKEALWYKREWPHHKLRYVDVPTERLDQWRAIAHEGARAFSRRPGTEYFLPGALADRARLPLAGRVMFQELCFSPDKSVSVEWAFSTPGRRAAIRAAHERAVDAGMAKVEERLGLVRLGRGGLRGMERGELAWIAFAGEHTYSRRGDPQIHTHVAILNVVRSLESDKVGSLPKRELHGHFADKTFERAYQQELARELFAIGIDIGHDQTTAVTRVTGIPDAILTAMSGRTEEAREEAAKRAAEKGIDFDALTPAQQGLWTTNVAADTRQDKEPDPPDFHEWVARAVEAVGTEEWNRMAEARGWTRHDPRTQQIAERVREGRDRNSAGLSAEYNRGGSRAYDWEISR